MNILPAETKMNSSKNLIWSFSMFDSKIHRNKRLFNFFSRYQDKYQEIKISISRQNQENQENKDCWKNCLFHFYFYVYFNRVTLQSFWLEIIINE